MPTATTATHVSDTHYPTGENSIFAIGSALYATRYNDATTGHVYMEKSTDGGLTWTELDSGNRPNDGEVTLAIQGIRSGSDIVVFYKRVTPFSGGGARTSSICFCTFSTTTDTWGTPETSGPSYTGTNTQIRTINAGEFATIIGAGDYLVCYSRPTVDSGAGEPEMNYCRYSGGAWGAEVNINAAVLFPLLATNPQVYRDPASGVFHFYWGEGRSTVKTWYHRGMSAAFSLDSLQTLLTIGPLTGHGSAAPIIGGGVKYGANLYLPYINFYDATNGNKGRPAVFSGDASLTSPSWTLTVVGTDEVFFVNTNASVLVINGVTGNLVLAWSPFTSTGFVEWQIVYREFNGSSWDASTSQWYDLNTIDPPPSNPGGVAQDLADLTLLSISGDIAGFTVSARVGFDALSTAEYATYFWAYSLCCCSDFAY